MAAAPLGIGAERRGGRGANFSVGGLLLVVFEAAGTGDVLGSVGDTFGIPDLTTRKAELSPAPGRLGWYIGFGLIGTGADTLLLFLPELTFKLGAEAFVALCGPADLEIEWWSKDGIFAASGRLRGGSEGMPIGYVALWGGWLLWSRPDILAWLLCILPGWL